MKEENDPKTKVVEVLTVFGMLFPQASHVLTQAMHLLAHLRNQDMSLPVHFLLFDELIMLHEMRS